MMDLQLIQNKIYEIRGQRVMLDFDLQNSTALKQKGSKRLYVVIWNYLRETILCFN